MLITVNDVYSQIQIKDASDYTLEEAILVFKENSYTNIPEEFLKFIAVNLTPESDVYNLGGDKKDYTLKQWNESMEVEEIGERLETFLPLYTESLARDILKMYDKVNGMEVLHESRKGFRVIDGIITRFGKHMTVSMGDMLRIFKNEMRRGYQEVERYKKVRWFYEKVEEEVVYFYKDREKIKRVKSIFTDQ